MPVPVPPEIGTKVARLLSRVEPILLLMNGHMVEYSAWQTTWRKLYEEEYYKIIKENCKVFFCDPNYGVVLSCEGALVGIEYYYSSAAWKQHIDELCEGAPEGRLGENVLLFYLVNNIYILKLSLLIDDVKPFVLPSYKDVTVQITSLSMAKTLWDSGIIYTLRGYAYVGEGKKYGAKLPSLSIDFKVLGDNTEIEYVNWDYEKEYPLMPVKKPENFSWDIAEEEMFTEFWRLYYGKIEDTLKKASPILGAFGRTLTIYLLY
jgi:hypothetical protein